MLRGSGPESRRHQIPGLHAGAVSLDLVLSIATAGAVLPGPASSPFVGNGLYLHRLSTPPNVIDYGKLSCVCIGPHMYHLVDDIKAQNPDCKVLAYQMSGDVLDIAVPNGFPAGHPFVPTWAQYRGHCYSTVTYNEALVWNANNQGDHWRLTASGTWIKITGFTPLLANFSKVSFRNAWKTRIDQRFANEPLWDGVFIDNCSMSTTFSPAPPGLWPAELPSQALFGGGLKDFLGDCASHVLGTGRIVAINANHFVNDDGAQEAKSNNGLGIREWWADIGDEAWFTGLSAAAKRRFVFFSEYTLSQAGTKANRREGTSHFEEFWQTWHETGDAARDLGAAYVLTGVLHDQPAGDNPGGSQARYARASAFLDWDGVGLYAGFFTYSTTPWSGHIAFPLGEPVGARFTSNGCYLRQGEGGWVAVNPTSTQKTVNVGGTNRTIAAADAYIGV